MEILATLGRHAGIYGWYYAGACLRFFAVAGAMYLVLDVWLRGALTAHRIQKQRPERAAIAHEIRAALGAMACSGFASVLLYKLVEGGFTRLYYEPAAYGWTWLVLSVAVGIVGYDTWFYWQHRMLHTPWWFERAHAVHHRSTNPTPFANFAHTWTEITLGNVYFIGLVLVLPMHPAAVALVSMFIFGWGMITHSGYEFFPRWFARSPLFGWINSSTHHNMHHSHSGGNYGMFFNFWDRVMGTNHPLYRATFEGIRRPAPAAPSADLDPRTIGAAGN